MPQFGVGILPSGAVGTELAALTRRAFVPRLVVQIYKATPLLGLLMRNAQKAKGGASQITVPVQGGSYTQFSWSDYSGVFPQPQVLTAAQNAEFNLKLGVVPIPFMGMESLVQSSEVVVPILKARMADAKTVAVQAISGALFTNNYNVPGQTQVDSLYQAYDDGTNVTNYGGISRTANTYWKSTVKTAVGVVTNTRVGAIKYIVNCTALAGGEAPDFMLMAPGDWTTLMTDFMANSGGVGEQFNTGPKSRYGIDDVVNAGFRAIMLGDTPIFMDPFCPQGTAYLFNSRYLAMYISEDAPFAFSGFYSSIPNLQIANIGVVIVAFNVVCSKPSSGMKLTGITGQSF
jgi:hypothetical protein